MKLLKIALVFHLTFAFALGSTYHLDYINSTRLLTQEPFNPLPSRNLATCGDISFTPCYNCLQDPSSKYCKYTKAFKVYKCCPSGDSEGLCGSTDPDVICSDKFTGL